MCSNSVEYQGDGWGYACLKDGNWKSHTFLDPIWNSNPFPKEQTTWLLVHARSAFESYEVELEFNMPFGDQNTQFLFNGEIHGVRINVPGTTGAQKIFNLTKKMFRGDWQKALQRTVGVIKKRSRYLKASNIFLVSDETLWGATFFSENPDYFSLWKHERSDCRIICSGRLDGFETWESIPNNSFFKMEAGTLQISAGEPNSVHSLD